MKNPMIEGVRWTERYAERFEKYWSLLPKYVTNSLVTIVIFILASGIQGECVNKFFLSARTHQ